MDEKARLQEQIAELTEELAAKEQIEAELRASDERFRKVFEYSHDAIFVVDPEADEIIDANRRACEMLGYSREEILNVPMSAIHPHEIKRLREFAEGVWSSGEGFTEELSCMAKNGELVSAEVSASLVHIQGRPCMIAFVRDVSERKRLVEVNEVLRNEFRSELRFGRIVGRSEALMKVLEQVERVAQTNASVLITGESGTGKELVANEIHSRSQRASQSMVRVNLASIPRELFESEFFGHVKGAFTGAVADRVGRFKLAHGGSIFLDEVGEIPMELQGKLLRVLQEGQFERVGESRTQTVDVRVIAATNRDLREEVEAGRFREDLFYRLSVFPIHIPPLRERPEDIAPIALNCLEVSAKRLGVPSPSLSPSNQRLLESYSWPGNVRELQNVIERALISSDRGPLKLQVPSQPRPTTGNGESENGSTIDMSLEDLKSLEREIITKALRRRDWKVYGPDGAAADLELPPTTLASKMKRLGIRRP